MRTTRNDTDRDSDCDDSVANSDAGGMESGTTASSQTKISGRTKHRSFVTTTITKNAIKDFKASPKTMPFLDLWERCEPFIRMKCGQKGLRAQETSDVLADVRIAVYNNVKSYDEGKGRFHAWLGTITRYKIMNVLRERIPYEERNIQVGDEAKFGWIAGQPDIPGEITEKVKVKPPVGAQTEPESKPVSGTGLGRMKTAQSRKPGPGTLLDKMEGKKTADAALASVRKRTAQRVKPRQWQMFESTVLREIPIPKVCKAMSVTPNMVSIARHRVGKIFDEELEAESEKLQIDLGAHRVQVAVTAKKIVSASKPAKARPKPKRSTT